MILVPHKPKTTKRRGKMIVIEGADGSGKATQADLLLKYLRKQKVKVKYYDFPQYGKNFFGDMVAAFLRGEYGPFKTLSPYLLSLPYTLDRAAVAYEMEEWLSKGGWIICNRYVSSHLAHQTARISNAYEQTRFLKWVQRLEYEELSVVREDMVIVLQVPPQIASKLTDIRASYKNAKLDVTERDKHHQQSASDMYVKLARKLPHWKLIRCTDKSGALLPIASIHEKVVQSLP